MDWIRIGGNLRQLDEIYVELGSFRRMDDQNWIR